MRSSFVHMHYARDETTIERVAPDCKDIHVEVWQSLHRAASHVKRVCMDGTACTAQTSLHVTASVSVQPQTDGVCTHCHIMQMNNIRPVQPDESRTCLCRAEAVGGFRGG